MRSRKAQLFLPPDAGWRECWRAISTRCKRSAGAPYGTVRTCCHWTHFSIELGASGWDATETRALRYCWIRRKSRCCGSGLSANRQQVRRCCRSLRPRGKAMDTWRLIAEYRFSVDGSFEASEDWAAFASWSREFRRRCETNRWLEAARSERVFASAGAAGESSFPGGLR